MEPIRDPEANETTNLHQLGRLDKARVLEIGCGNGRLTWRYAARAAAVVGLDPSLERLAAAGADRPSNLADSVSFLQGAAETLPFPTESFDVIIMAWSL
jgi:ubiquinone/menaquinone biosynthesis C-methylase UbiE